MIHLDGSSFEDIDSDGSGPASFYREALEAAGVGTWRLDMVSGLCAWDEATSRLLGLPPMLTETPALAVVHPDDQDRVAASLERSFATAALHDVEFRIVLPDGGTRQLRGMARPRQDKDGSRRWLYGVTIDVSARSASDQALVESKRQLATLIDNLPGMAYRCPVKPPWKLDYASDGAEAITGYSAEEWMSGQVLWVDLVHEDDLDALAATVDAAVAARKPYWTTYRIRNRAGEIRWLQERAQPVHADDGRALYLEGFIGDITEQKLLEESLRDAQREALATSQKLGAVLENTLDCVYSLDEQMRFTYLNANALAQYDGDLSLLGKSILDVIPGAEHTDFGRCYQRVIRTRVAETIEGYFALKGRWFHCHVTPTEGGITIFYRDISDRKEAEEKLHQSTARARSILDSVPQIVWSADAGGSFDYVSPQWQAFTGRADEHESNQGWSNAIHPDDVGDALAAWHACVASGRPLDLEMRLRHHSGSYRWILNRASPQRDAEGNIVRWYGTCTDVHERVLAQAALEESEAITRSILEASPDCIKLLDQDGRILFVNPLGPQAIGLGETTPLIGALWTDLLAPDAATRAAGALRRARAGDIARFTLPLAVSGARRKWWDVVVTPVAGSDGSRTVVVTRDITHQKQSEEQVRWAANHDPLTGLPNRLLFQERLDEIAAVSGPGSGFALLLLDVDDFKRVNDSLGHDAGDALLCAFGERLRAATRPDDFVARLGGDEFAVILTGAENEEQVSTAAEAILGELRQPHIQAGRVLDCNASIGASIYPGHGLTRAELLKHADIALYAAKSSWRGNLRLFQPAMRSEMQNRVSMVALARNALKNDLIVPYYQPKIDLRSGRVAGFEALLRWRDPRRGIQTPDTISAAFEDINTAAEISDRMIDLVIADMRRWLDEGLDFGHVAINAAAAEFRKGGFAEAVLARLAQAQLPAERVQIEVTETVFLGRGADCVERALKALSEAGVRIALDDFGTGYASLSHLKQFPVDVLKVDRSFVSELGENDDAAAIVRAVINLGRSLDMEVVAEGIETVGQASWLTQRGCHLGQGHLYAPASAAADLAGILARFNGDQRAA